MFSVKFSSRVGQDTTALFLWEYLSNVIPYKFQNRLAEFHEKSLWNSNYGCIASLDQFRENRHFYSIWSSIQERSTDLHIFVFLNIHWILNVVVGDLQIPVWNPFQNFLKWSPPNLRALSPAPPQETVPGGLASNMDPRDSYSYFPIPFLLASLGLWRFFPGNIPSSAVSVARRGRTGSGIKA